MKTEIVHWNPIFATINCYRDSICCEYNKINENSHKFLSSSLEELCLQIEFRNLDINDMILIYFYNTNSWRRDVFLYSEFKDLILKKKLQWEKEIL